jgi:hypothetical protein
MLPAIQTKTSENKCLIFSTSSTVFEWRDSLFDIENNASLDP